MPNQSVDNFPQFVESPPTVTSPGDAAEWVESQRDEVQSAIEDAGAILFRGFPLQTANDFDAFVAAFWYPNFRYADSLSNAVRIGFTDRVFSANEAPADVAIYLHHEMAQTPIFPSKLFFFCEQPAASGGATPLCRSDILLERLTQSCPAFVADCERHGLRYSSVMPSHDDAGSGMGRSWQSTLGQTRSAAECRLNDLGYTWEWLNDGCLRATTPILPAIREHSGRHTFFNQLIAAFCGWKDSRNDPSKSITFGNGDPLDPDTVMVAVQLANELAVNVEWQQGDVALVNNFLVMHGRRHFTGTRKVLASLVR